MTSQDLNTMIESLKGLCAKATDDALLPSEYFFVVKNIPALIAALEAERAEVERLKVAQEWIDALHSGDVAASLNELTSELMALRKKCKSYECAIETYGKQRDEERTQLTSERKAREVAVEALRTISNCTNELNSPTYEATLATEAIFQISSLTGGGA